MRPRRVLIIGLLFCICGVLSIGEVIHAALNGRLSINFGVLLLPVGIGLLRGKDRSRSWARFWIVLGYLACTLLPILGTLHPSGLKVDWFGFVRRGSAAIPFAWTFAILLGLVLWWIHRLLYSDEASAYFSNHHSSA